MDGLSATPDRNEQRGYPEGARISGAFDVQGRTNVAGAGCAGATLGYFLVATRKYLARGGETPLSNAVSCREATPPGFRPSPE